MSDPKANRIGSPKYTGFNWRMIAFAALFVGILAVFGRLGTLCEKIDSSNHPVANVTPVSGPAPVDTRLSTIKDTPTIIENSFNNYYGSASPSDSKPAAKTPALTVAIEPVETEQPKTVVVLPKASAPHPGDLTVVIVKPEVRPPESRVIVIDERAERLRREYLERKHEWATRPASLAGSW